MKQYYKLWAKKTKENKNSSLVGGGVTYHQALNNANKLLNQYYEIQIRKEYTIKVLKQANKLESENDGTNK
ncbi:hypothetical protein [Metamycoplasma salivarium]|uniref:hypothetical protein n=1 Tax=Metamycoplasma salivarium TaxID=2124 RepID=UPI001F3DC7AD|nr:hypothetical protein [Metamycoplasma salivarium]GIZ06673.1 hypothetical protein MSATCC33130_0270 [Metamycoplasma salivarium]